MRIKDQLIYLADQWAEANGKSIATLAKIVVSDNKFFVRISQPGKDLHTETFEKFLSFFRDGANWPDGRISEPACELLDNFSTIALPAPAHPGASGDCAGADAATPLLDGELPPHISSPGRAGEAGAEEPARFSAPAERVGQDAGDMAA